VHVCTKTTRGDGDSFVAEGGCEVYVLDWGHPTPADQFDNFDDLVNLYLDGFVDAICDRHGISAINLVGVCQGGVLSLCYTALHPERVRNLVTCVTPVDFTSNSLSIDPPHARSPTPTM